MKKKCFVKEASVLLILALIVSSVGVLVANAGSQTATGPFVNKPVSLGKTWYVDDVPGYGPDNPYEYYTKIQDAINAAKSGDTVYVYSGTYVEHVSIEGKTITLRGENKDTTIIDGKNGRYHTATVKGSHGVSISGFTIKNNVNCDDIFIDYSNGTTISGNILSNDDNGIRLVYSNSNTISGNTVFSSSGYAGIDLYSSSDNTISGNILSLNSYTGIHLGYSNGNTISGNTITDVPDQHSAIDGIKIYDSSGNTISGNTISNYGDGISLDASSGNTISGNILSLNSYTGIHLGYSSGNTISGNTISDNTISNYGDGIRLGDSSGNTISGNTISNNYHGMYLRGSDNNIIGGSTIDLKPNKILNNTVGIYFSGSQGYTKTALYQNNVFLDNGDDISGLPRGKSINLFFLKERFMDRFPILAHLLKL